MDYSQWMPKPPEKPSQSEGGIYSEAFLAATKPLYSMHMGCENMGPMLYTLIRFVKPLELLEVGAGECQIYRIYAFER